MKYAKLDNGRIVLPPTNYGNIINTHLNPEWLSANGYELHDDAWFVANTPLPEPTEADLRFAEIKADFWAVVDAACAECNKTRADLPDRFNAEDMITLATINGMTATSLAGYAQKFMVISLDLLHNYRNWDELFKE